MFFSLKSKRHEVVALRVGVCYNHNGDFFDQNNDDLQSIER